ncbi:MAG TPA: hypothetical protein VJ955_00445 [Desulfuromonadales bacterium]|nr:hypothetical protein [Desulfuromonadales bacterium]
MDWNVFQVLLWLIAGLVSFSFSLGNARVWTSIAVGFFLILLGELIPQAIPYLPGHTIPQIQMMGHIIGTIAILAMTHGFQEYYVFSKTLEMEGRRRYVYLTTAVVVCASLGFVLINPAPTADTVRLVQVVENTNWVFLALINLDMLRKIYLNVKGSPIARGFLAFMAVFLFIFLWKGSALYIQVYGLDHLAMHFPFRYNFSLLVGHLGSILASLSVGATFLYLARLLR